MDIPFEQIIHDYYIRKHTNKQIFSEYDLSRRFKNVESERVTDHLPPYIFTQINCEYCGSQFHAQFRSKQAWETSLKIETSLNSSKLRPTSSLTECPPSISNSSINCTVLSEEGYRVSFPSCSVCSHQPSKYCRCNNCELIKKTNLSKLEEILSQELSKHSGVQINEMSCRDLHQIALILYLIRSDPTITSDELAKFSYKLMETLTCYGVLLRRKNWLEQSTTMSSLYEYSFEPDQISYSVMSSQKADELFQDVRHIGIQVALDRGRRLEIFDVWLLLALREAEAIFGYYCKSHSIQPRVTRDTRNLICEGLKTYGLSYTCRYICNSIRRAKITSSEGFQQGASLMDTIYNNLSFWLLDCRARGYSARPFVRKSGALAERDEIRIFRTLFLEPINLDYFNSPIANLNLESN